MIETAHKLIIIWGMTAGAWSRGFHQAQNWKSWSWRAWIGAPLSVVLILGQKVLPLASRQGWFALILFRQSSCLWPRQGRWPFSWHETGDKLCQWKYISTRFDNSMLWSLWFNESLTKPQSSKRRLSPQDFKNPDSSLFMPENTSMNTEQTR